MTDKSTNTENLSELENLQDLGNTEKNKDKSNDTDKSTNTENLSELENLQDLLGSCNINFLLGAGCSQPYLPILGNIEKNIEENKDNTEKQVEYYQEYFLDIMLPVKDILDKDKFKYYKPYNNDNNCGDEEKTDENFKKTIDNYTNFLKLISKWLVDRKSTILDKQVNIYTTNIDIFLEHCLEQQNLAYCDGSVGKLNPYLDLSQFNNSIIKKSSHFSYSSEIPIINLLKIHGSLSWKECNKEDKIYFNYNLDHFQEDWSKKDNFMNLYKKNIMVVNPNKDKFKHTILDRKYYDMLRLYSTALEKENSILFVIGFSMADEHIRDLTIRIAKQNPTLAIYIFTFNHEDLNEDTYDGLNTNNIKFISDGTQEFGFEKIIECLQNPSQYQDN